MSKDLAKRLGFKISSNAKMTRLTLGDGRKIFANEFVQGVELSFGLMTVIVDFLLLKTPDYQMLLGRGFLKQVNASTDWRTTKFRFEYNGRIHEFVDGSKPQGTGNLNLIEADEDYIDHDLRITDVVFEDKAAVESVLEENNEVFGLLPQVVKIGSYHKLEVVGKPVKQRAYRVSPGEDAFIQKEIEKLLKANIIKSSKSPLASPVVLAGKKDGSLRFRVNYKKLNDYVMLKGINTSKLKPKWKGYYKIVAVGPNNSYQLEFENGKKLPNWVNGRRLQRYRLD